MDKIKIEDLEVFANHGVFPEENTLGQKFIVSAVLYTDTRKAGKKDDLTASIHYGESGGRAPPEISGNECDPAGDQETVGSDPDPP